MERPGKRVQEIPEDPREQLKLALQGKLDEIEINDIVYTFKPKGYGPLTTFFAIYVTNNTDHIGYYDIRSKNLNTGVPMYFLTLKEQFGIIDLMNFRKIHIDNDKGIVVIIFRWAQERREFSEQFPDFAFEYNKVFIHDRNLVERLKNVVLKYYEPFLALLYIFEPRYKNVQFSVSNNLRLVSSDGQKIYNINFKQFPSLNKLAWKKLTPEKQQEFNIYAPNECRICQKPTEVMCSQTRIPFCSKECQMKYF